MKFKVDNHEKHSEITILVEKLDALSAPDLKSEFVYLVKSGTKNVIVNLENARYCDSSGLSALLTGNRLCKDHDGSFVISNLQPAVQKLVSISQLDHVLEITPTVNEAIDIVMMDEVERDIKKTE